MLPSGPRIIMAAVQSAITVPAPPPASSQGVRASMRGNKRRDTSPEKRLRSTLHREGYRFRVDRPIKTESGAVRPDLVFPRARVAVFVDGCFWHCCPEHGRDPTTNPGYWGPKLRRNRERDVLQTDALERGGWLVVRIWEHVGLPDARDEVVAALNQRMAESQPTDRQCVPRSQAAPAGRTPTAKGP